MEKISKEKDGGVTEREGESERERDRERDRGSERDRESIMEFGKDIESYEWERD